MSERQSGRRTATAKLTHWRHVLERHTLREARDTPAQPVEALSKEPIQVRRETCSALENRPARLVYSGRDFEVGILHAAWGARRAVRTLICLPFNSVSVRATAASTASTSANSTYAYLRQSSDGSVSTMDVDSRRLGEHQRKPRSHLDAPRPWHAA